MNIETKVDKVLSEQKGILEKISKVKDNVKNVPDDKALLEVNILYYFKIALKS